MGYRHGGYKNDIFLWQFATVFTVFFIMLSPPIFGQSISLEKITNTNFGKIEFSPPLSNSLVAMGTNGSIDYDSAFSGNGIGTSGSVTISTTVNTIVEISCEKTAKISNISGQKFFVSIAASIGENNRQNWQNSPQCNGINKTLHVHTISNDSTNNTIFLGGKMTISSTPSGFEHSSNNIKGIPAQIRVIVQ